MTNSYNNSTTPSPPLLHKIGHQIRQQLPNRSTLQAIIAFGHALG